jgi:hypothetical protein
MNLIKKAVLLIPFSTRVRITEFLHPDTRCISYTFIWEPYSEEELRALGLEEDTIHIHNDIIYKLAEKRRKDAKD